MKVQKHVFSASECRKWHLHIQNFSGEHAPGPPKQAPSLHDIHTLMLRPLQATLIKKIMLNLIVATQSLVLEASSTMVFFMSNLLKYTAAEKVAR